MDVSIIICTRNRAAHLQETLRALAATSVPPEFDIELLVVDNGSTDGTASVVEANAPRGWPVRRLVEPEPGVARARNRGIAEAAGDILLFTDDDVRVPREWIGPMVAPIRQGTAEAVAGGVTLAESLRRDWMTLAHTEILADTETLQVSGGTRLVGANMAVARSVFAEVPGFDPHLGPGVEATGFHEETLFSFQMQRAGFRIVKELEIAVDHHLQPHRLLYSAIASEMRKRGRSDAYLHHHWQHATPSRARSILALGFWRLRLASYRLVPGCRRAPTDEGMAPTEMDIRRRIAFHRHMLRLYGRPRRYDRLGVVRRGETSPPPRDGRQSISETPVHSSEPSIST